MLRAYVRQQRERKRKETETTNARGALPPLLGEETIVNEIDSFPTHKHNHPPPSVFDKHDAHTSIRTHAHTQTHAPATETSP